MSGKLSEFIGTGDGPFLLLPEASLADWDGINPPRDGREIEATFRWNDQEEATDYDRACDVKGYLGVLEVGDAAGLVLGDMPDITAWYEISPESGMLVRWFAAKSKEAVKAALDALPALWRDLAWEDAGQITFRASPLILFEAAEPGYDITYDALKIDLPDGTYKLWTILYKPDSETELVLHRLEPLLPTPEP